MPGFFSTPRPARRLAGAALLLAGALPASQAAQIDLLYNVPPPRASHTAAGTSQAAALSADGRYFVFESNAPNLVPGQVDSNRANDIFVYDRGTGTTTLVSRSKASPARTGDGVSWSPAISADGRYITFVSTAPDLTTGRDTGQDTGQDLGKLSDVFLYDRAAGTTILVSRSKASPGLPGDGLSEHPVLSADGRYVAFSSVATDLVDRQVDLNQTSDVFLYDRRSGRTALVSHTAASASQTGNGQSISPSLSADGRFIAFQSDAQDLVPGLTPQGFSPLAAYVQDRLSGKTVLASPKASSRTTAGGVRGLPSISANGECVVYTSFDTDLVPGQMLGRGQNDHNVFLFHRPSGTTVLVSHASDSPLRAGSYPSEAPFLSADCGRVAFVSFADDLVAGQTEEGSRTLDVFLFERATGQISIVSRVAGSPAVSSNAQALLGGLSADGSRVAFASYGRMIVSPPLPDVGIFGFDVFLYDHRSGQAFLASQAEGPGVQEGGNNNTSSIALSADGDWIGFATVATNLKPEVKDLNQASDVFLWSRAGQSHELVSRRDPALRSRTPEVFSTAGGGLSADGRWAVFASEAPNLLPRVTDVNGGRFGWDVFLYDRTLKSTKLLSRSVTSPLKTGNGPSPGGGLSLDGRHIAFVTYATDMAPGQDPDAAGDLILHDRVAGTNTLVSPPVPGAQVGSFGFSGDGSVLLYNLDNQIYLYDLAAKTTRLISHAFGSPSTPGDRQSSLASASANGRFVLFFSEATNLLPDPVEETFDLRLYLYDRTSGEATLVTANESEDFSEFPRFDGAAVVSPDGRWVAFGSNVTDLVPGQVDTEEDFGSPDLFLWDRTTGSLRLLTHAPGSPTIAVGAAPSQTPGFSQDSRYLVFCSAATLIPNQPADASGVFLLDLVSGTLEVAGRLPASRKANGSPFTVNGGVSMSPDGRYVAFSAVFPDEPLIPGVTPPHHVFLYDRTARTTRLVSAARGTPARPARPANGSSFFPVVSTGGYVLFSSSAPDLVEGDFNGLSDLFLYSPGDPQ